MSNLNTVLCKSMNGKRGLTISKSSYEYVASPPFSYALPVEDACTSFSVLVLQCVICALHSCNGMFTCTTITYLLIDPSKVTGVFSTIIETTSLNVIWAIPQSDMTITQYQVQYRTKEATSWSSCPPVSGSPPATSTVVNELKSGFEYKVRVRAWSAVGAGKWSDERTPCCKFVFWYASPTFSTVYVIHSSASSHTLALNIYNLYIYIRIIYTLIGRHF